MTDLSDSAIDFIKKNEKLLIKTFADPEVFIQSEHPFTLFMAGEPGAGKTEFSKSYIKELINKDPDTQIVRIDADEIRDLIPGYNGKNAFEVQGACGLGVDKLFNYIQKKKLNAIVDGTFSNFQKSREDVRRAINRDRKVELYFIYQNPLVAWDFTKKREALENRHVSKEMFIEAYFLSKENVNKIKKEFGSSVEVSLVIKNVENLTEKTYFNIELLDGYIKEEYNRVDLLKILS